MKSFFVVSVLLAHCPFFISGSSPIRVALKSKATSEGTLLKSTSSIEISNSSSVAFWGEMSLGTPAQSFDFAFDLSSSVLWIPGTACDDDCGNSTLFNSTASTTFVAGTGDSISADFDYFGTVVYTVNNDTLEVGSLNATSQEFGLVTSMALTLSGVDGFAGLGPGTESFVTRILSQNNLSDIFSFYIDSTSSDVAGEIILGGTPSDYSTADSLLNVTSLSEEQWQLQIQNISVGSTTIECTSCVAVISVLGNPYITGPEATIEAMYDAINANSSGYVNSSDDLPDVALAISGYSFNLTKDEYLLSCSDDVCQTKFVKDSTTTVFTLGTVFVSKYFWFFNTTSYEIGIVSLKSGSSTLQHGFFVLTSLVWAWIFLDRRYHSY